MDIFSQNIGDNGIQIFDNGKERQQTPDMR
jgi:hypothetical protein